MFATALIAAVVGVVSAFIAKGFGWPLHYVEGSFFIVMFMVLNWGGGG